MARIPVEVVERLKAEVAVERLVESAGVELKPVGKDLVGRCLWHDDAQASLVITPAKNLWHCFSCQIGGGPIDWMMRTKSVSFRHAVELLRSGDALTAPRARGARMLAAAVDLDAGDQALLDQAITYYQERLKQTPEALAYLARRGLDDAQLIERHRLCVASATSGQKASAKMRDFELLRTLRRRSEVDEQTRTSTIYCRTETGNFEGGGPAGRDRERGVPAPCIGGIGVLSLAGGGPGRLGGGAQARRAAYAAQG
jgi:DNA primase